LSALADRGERAFCDPIAITRDRIVIDGYARLELAKRTGRQMLDCFEYELRSEDALEELIRTHCASRGLTDFVRIELALDLESHFQRKALINQQAGGQGKGLSKLTIAEQVNTRREVARLAAVSCGNVRKVKNILADACSSLRQAAREEEVSINLADRWCLEPEAQQQEHLRLMRIERGIKRKARNLVAAHLARVSPSTRDRQVIKLSDLVGLLNIGSVEVEIVDAPGRTMFATKELIDSLTQRQGALVG
jgi:DNA polymerase III delta prime subunit